MSHARADPQGWRSPEPLFDRIAHGVRAVVWLLVDVRVLHPERLPRQGSLVLAANHVSRLDPLVVGAVVHRLRGRLRFLAVSGLFDVPVVGWLLRTTRMIPVQRGAGPEPMAAAASAALDAGQVIVVYPEGTVPAPGHVLPARPGAGLLALEAAERGVPVVPVASAGLHRGSRRIPRLLRRPATVAFGPAVDLSAWAGRRDRQAQIEAGTAVLAAVRALLVEADPETPGT